MNAAQEKVIQTIAYLEGRYGEHKEAEYKPIDPRKTTKDIIEQIEMGLAGTDILSQLTEWINKQRNKYHQGKINQEELEQAEARNRFYYRKLNKIVQRYGEPKETIEQILEAGLPYLERYKNNTIGLAQTRIKE